jgi:hypothetical protein
MSQKIFFSLNFIFNVLLLSAQVQGTVVVQATKSWAWTNYQVAFEAPTDLAVKENSEKVFYAGNGHVYLTIYPRVGDSLSHDNLPQALQKWASEYKFNYSASSNSGYLTNSNRYWAYYLSGTGYKGMATYAAIVVDVNNPTKSYYVWLQYENGYAGAAMNILNSFSAQ